MLGLLMISSSCFATGNFTSSTGTVVIRDVAVDGTTVYDSVKLQLNFDNGTFTILDAIQDGTGAEHFSETAMDTWTQNNIKIDFMGCIISGTNIFSEKNQITCMTKVVSLIGDQQIHVLGNSSSGLVDNQGKEYMVTTIVALDKSSPRTVTFNAIDGIPVKVKFIYHNFDPAATSISAFKPAFYPSNSSHIEANFQDTDTLSSFK